MEIPSNILKARGVKEFFVAVTQREQPDSTPVTTAWTADFLTRW